MLRVKFPDEPCVALVYIKEELVGVIQKNTDDEFEDISERLKAIIQTVEQCELAEPIAGVDEYLKWLFPIELSYDVIYTEDQDGEDYLVDVKLQALPLY